MAINTYQEEATLYSVPGVPFTSCSAPLERRARGYIAQCMQTGADGGLKMYEFGRFENVNPLQN